MTDMNCFPPTDHIVLQWDKIEEIARVPSTNLLVHGFDESKTAVWADPVTGAAPIVWNRAVGWYIWSLVEVLDIFPQSHPGYARLMGYFTTLADGLKRAQDPESNGWWLVMSDPYIGVEGNYLESSAAAMFTYGWLAGMKRGWISEEEYLGPASRAYSHMIQDFVTENADGTITWEKTVEVGSLGSNATFEVYFVLFFPSGLEVSLLLTKNKTKLPAVLHRHPGCATRHPWRGTVPTGCRGMGGAEQDCILKWSDKDGIVGLNQCGDLLRNSLQPGEDYILSYFKEG